jgi:hypothetical protein
MYRRGQTRCENSVGPVVPLSFGLYLQCVTGTTLALIRSVGLYHKCRPAKREPRRVEES